MPAGAVSCTGWHQLRSWCLARQSRNAGRVRSTGRCPSQRKAQGSLFEESGQKGTATWVGCGSPGRNREMQHSLANANSIQGGLPFPLCVLLAAAPSEGCFIPGNKGLQRVHSAQPPLHAQHQALAVLGSRQPFRDTGPEITGGWGKKLQGGGYSSEQPPLAVSDSC